ncbi:MAG: hypothetical protein ACQGVK_13040 [Myxococcota bacterium]
MADLQPRGEALRKAVRFVSQKREDDPAGSVVAWVQEATVRFDLNPAQGEWLGRFMGGSAAGDAPSDD